MVMSSFYKDAEYYIRNNADRIINEFLSDSFDGKWHPMGFAVFHLGEIKGLGKLRFHMWPRNLRVSLSGQPVIHSHPREICSYVVAGYFKDATYKAKKAATSDENTLQAFEARYTSDVESEVYPVPDWYEVNIDEARVINEGKFHHIRTGELHGVHMTEEDFATTILLTSEETHFDKIMLLGDGSVGNLPYDRPIVNVEQYAHMKKDLLETMPH